MLRALNTRERRKQKLLLPEENPYFSELETESLWHVEKPKFTWSESARSVKTFVRILER